MADSDNFRQQLAAADVVVYGSGVRHALPQLLPPQATAIELSHIPDAESIANLRRHLGSLKGRASATSAGVSA
jgi:hypothetical protein